jgi:hypothetical protein
MTYYKCKSPAAGLGSPKATECNEPGIARAEGIAQKTNSTKNKNISAQNIFQPKNKIAIGIRRAWFAKGNRV